MERKLIVMRSSTGGATASFAAWERAVASAHRAASLAAFVAAVLLVVACASPRSEPPSTPTTPPGVTGKAPPGAIVSLDPLPAREFPMPDGPAVMDQYAKQFVPDLVVARVGQAVEFLNSDDFGHNVIVNRRSTGASVFSVSLDTRQKYVFVFTQPGEYAVMCDIHEGMLATVFVTSSPYSARVDASGRFTVADVPPGSYQASMVLSGGGSKQQRVEVSGARTALKFTP